MAMRNCETMSIDPPVSADEEHAALAGGGAYAMPWHWHDCLMFILPSWGTVELKHEDRREGAWLLQDRFAVVPSNRAHETPAALAHAMRRSGGHTPSDIRRLLARLIKN